MCLQTQDVAFNPNPGALLQLSSLYKDCLWSVIELYCIASMACSMLGQLQWQAHWLANPFYGWLTYDPFHNSL